MRAYCCTIWQGLAPEIQEYKAAELKDVEPRSLVFPVLTVLGGITAYCPVCGVRIQEREAPSRQAKPVAVEPPVSPIDIPKTIPCQATGCKDGYQSKGKDSKGFDTKCAVCVGKGVVPNPAWLDAAVAKANAANERAVKEKRIQ